MSRKGEAKRFKPFKALPNRTLLWHGSRTTNFAGILSQVTRIKISSTNKAIGILSIFRGGFIMIKGQQRKIYYNEINTIYNGYSLLFVFCQGLRIAPPEAPVTGYMFGKGIYFADMVSKSANYCCTNRTNNTG